ncbi:hypothetical protein E2562_022907 [Oryza meyeriana var. granulata]|uniref:Uncharacterized protein n=1 Tax=Oryza meyeriana var. granulata TaxID=110450 RepID=A0A6G1D5M4_9ORYZ|nr:hypothetical protein E2562_022907 [Oryza meyeriana var. granulata]
MGVLCFGASSILLCAEDSNSVLGLGGCGGEVAAEVGCGLDFLDSGGGAVFPVDSDEFVALLVEKEMDHLPQRGYVEKLELGGLESSWRKDAIDWICKVHSYYNFGPLSLYLSVNYLDRFLSSFNLLHDKSWMQQLLSVSCLSLAMKMEETVVPPPMDLQVCGAKYVFEARNIKRMELIVMETLKWRMQAVTPFSYISYFLDKFNEGKPPSYTLASWCAELTVDTLKDSRFLSFKPSEIAAAVVLAVLAENRFVVFSSALAASDIPVNKEMVMRCYELMLEKALVKKIGNSNASSSVPHSPITVLDAACFSFRSDDTTPGSSQSNNNNKNYNSQDSTPASKRRRLSTTPI